MTNVILSCASDTRIPYSASTSVVLFGARDRAWDFIDLYWSWLIRGLGLAAWLRCITCLPLHLALSYVLVGALFLSRENSTHCGNGTYDSIIIYVAPDRRRVGEASWTSHASMAAAFTEEAREEGTVPAVTATSGQSACNGKAVLERPPFFIATINFRCGSRKARKKVAGVSEMGGEIWIILLINGMTLLEDN